MSALPWLPLTVALKLTPLPAAGLEGDAVAVTVSGGPSKTSIEIGSLLVTWSFALRSPWPRHGRLY